MSTYWDVVCLDCDKTSGLYLRSGDDACRELVQAKTVLSLLALADITRLCIGIPGESGVIDLSFYPKHSTHVLAAVSEYGDIDGDCNDLRSTGPYTSDGARCRREFRHQGDHDYKLASRWTPEWDAVRKAAADRRRTP